jgi:non-specific serine/threonine protein kinase
VAGAYEDGVWLVELAPLSDPELVAQAVASVFGVREAPGRTLLETLAHHLGSKTVLIVLDNCEHLVEACASLAETLLRHCPNLRVLATSREALGVSGETLFFVPSLSLPDPRRLLAADSLSDYEAARLFVERARSVRPGFELTEQNAVAVAQICHRLDGMPLAIELAAARARALSAEQIASRLDDRFALLTGGRTVLAHHGTLRATMEWSYELLCEEEQTLFRRLSVFVGGFTLEAAEAVGSGGGTDEAGVLDLLTSLVVKSLVFVTERDGETRYGLLETVGQYGLERLEASGEAEPVRERHARYYLVLAEEAERQLREQGTWLRRLGTEHANLRAALGWSLDPQGSEERAELGLRLAAALGMVRFWNVYGPSEGLRWLDRGLAGSDKSPRPVRVKALSEAAWIAGVRGDHGKAIALLGEVEEAFAESRDLGGEQGVPASLVQLGQLLAMHGSDHQRVEALLEEAERLRWELPDQEPRAYLLLYLGLAALDRDHYERMVALLEESTVLFRKLGDTYGVGVCRYTMGIAAMNKGDLERAAALLEEAMHALQKLGDKVAIFHCLLGAAGVAGSRGEPTRAARLWGAAEALGEAFAVTVLPAIRPHYDYGGLLAAVRAGTDKLAWEAAWAEGRAMTPEQAVQYALEPTPEELNSPPAYPAGLSVREVEVLRLVARGMTNSQIATELYISPRTVNAHLGSVYHKIGSSNRAEATRFAAENDLL